MRYTRRGWRLLAAVLLVGITVPLVHGAADAPATAPATQRATWEYKAVDLTAEVQATAKDKQPTSQLQLIERVIPGLTAQGKEGWRVAYPAGSFAFVLKKSAAAGAVVEYEYKVLDLQKEFEEGQKTMIAAMVGARDRKNVVATMTQPRNDHWIVDSLTPLVNAINKAGAEGWEVVGPLGGPFLLAQRAK